MGSTTTSYSWVDGAPKPLAPAIQPVSLTAGGSASYSITLTFTDKRTWVPDSGQTMTSDPPPASIWVYQQANATVNGNGTLSAADGLGDVAIDVAGANPPKKISSPDDIDGKLKKIAVSGSVATVSCTLTASGSHSEPVGSSYTFTVGPSVSFTTTIHAQPYNLRPGPGESGHSSPALNAPYDGDLQIQYVFSSTSGSVADIDWSVVKLGEIVNYNASEGTVGSSNGKPTFIPPSPPFSPLLESENPTIVDLGPLPGGFFWDLHSAHQCVTPYRSATFTGTQKYVMNDTATGEVNVVLRGPLSIVRSVGPRIPYTAPWWYHVSKDGFENWLQLP